MGGCATAVAAMTVTIAARIILRLRSQLKNTLLPELPGNAITHDGFSTDKLRDRASAGPGLDHPAQRYRHATGVVGDWRPRRAVRLTLRQ
jgi:hypothetical protein